MCGTVVCGFLYGVSFTAGHFCPQTPRTANNTVAYGVIMPYTKQEILDTAKQVLKLEHDALATTQKSLDENFLKAVNVIAKCKGRVVIIGIGKSGLIGRKIAATMASTGTPAIFVHPVEALHGDLGMIMPGDVILALSFSLKMKTPGQWKLVGGLLFMGDGSSGDLKGTPHFSGCFR